MWTPLTAGFDVMWIEGKERKALRDYLELCRRDERVLCNYFEFLGPMPGYRSSTTP